MPRINYVPKTFIRSHEEIIELADEICMSYARQGLNLTLRQLYYQFIRRNAFPNEERSYKRLGNVISEARLAGRIDWNHLKDRGRHADGTGWFNHEEQTLAEMIQDAAAGYGVDLWKTQPYRVEVWVEKDSLIDVVKRGARSTWTPTFACKGYTSQSAMWEAAQRLIDYDNAGQPPIIFHLGDHDPSGIDMTRDIQDRLELFGANADVRRIALNMDQIDLYGPPPQPGKTEDPRFRDYAVQFGNQSWELDALTPEQTVDLIRDSIAGVMDLDAWELEVERESNNRADMERVASHWEAAVDFIEREFGDD